MSNKKKLKLQILILFLVLTIIPFVSLISARTVISDGPLNDTVITCNGLNLTITINSYLYGAVIVEDNSIYFENLRTSSPAIESLSFNITNERNKTYLESSLPKIVSETNDYLSKSIIINSGLENNITVSSIFLTGTNICKDIKSISYSSNSETNNSFLTTSFYCLVNVVTIPIVLEKGNNTLKINWFTSSTGTGSGSGAGTTTENNDSSINQTIDKTNANNTIIDPISKIINEIKTKPSEEWSLTTVFAVIVFIIIALGVISDLVRRKRRK
jgi:hypothetical protein